jgi:tetratricopeptide (TPR) repeat protein
MNEKKKKISLEKAFELKNDQKYLEAIKEIKLQIDIHGEDGSSTGMIALLYYVELNDPESALPYAEKAVQFSPNSEMASFCLTMCLKHFGRAEELDKEIKRFVATGQKLDLYETLFEENNLRKENFS